VPSSPWSSSWSIVQPKTAEKKVEPQLLFIASLLKCTELKIKIMLSNRMLQQKINAVTSLLFFQF